MASKYKFIVHEKKAKNCKQTKKQKGYRPTEKGGGGGGGGPKTASVHAASAEKGALKKCKRTTTTGTISDGKTKRGGLDLSLRFCSNIFSAQVSVSCALQLHLSLSRRLELTHHQHRSGPATESSLSLVYSPARLSTICMKRRKFMTLHRE